MSVSIDRVKNFVAGEFVDGVRDEWQQVINPATGETIAEVPKGSEEDVERAVEAADKTFAEWWAEFDCAPEKERELAQGIGQGVFQAAFDSLKQKLR